MYKTFETKEKFDELCFIIKIKTYEILIKVKRKGNIHDVNRVKIAILRFICRTYLAAEYPSYD